MFLVQVIVEVAHWTETQGKPMTRVPIQFRRPGDFCLGSVWLCLSSDLALERPPGHRECETITSNNNKNYGHALSRDHSMAVPLKPKA
jgi:hypothetical protein